MAGTPARLAASRTFPACVAFGAAVTAVALLAPTQAQAVRLPLALGFALLIPGYLLVCTLFPMERTLRHLPRLGLSLAASFALIILLTLIMSATPLARSGPAQLLAINGLVLLLAATATLRQWQRAAPERLYFTWSLDPGPDLRRDPLSWIAAGLCALLLLAALIGVWAGRGGQTTELSIPMGTATTGAIQPDGITVDVHSHESQAAQFQVRLFSGGQVLGQSLPVTIQPGQSWREHIAMTPPPGSGPTPVDVMLFKQGSGVPYRQLRVWLHTIPYRSPS